MDKEKSNNQTMHQVQSTNENLNVVASRLSSGSSSPNANQIPLFSVNYSPDNLTMGS